MTQYVIKLTSIYFIYKNDSLWASHGAMDTHWDRGSSSK